MTVPSAAFRVESLPWLRPATSVLLALTDEPLDPTAIRSDPALVVHLLRYARPTPSADNFAFDPAFLKQPGPLQTAAELLERFPHLPGLSTTSPAVSAGLSFARAAHEIASRTGPCSPDAAWTAGLLALLGDYAQSLDANSVTDEHRTGLELTRRLAARWRLPAWLSVAIGFPKLTPTQAADLGGHPGLTAVLNEARQAVSLKFDQELKTGEVEAPGLLSRLLRATAAARQRGGESLVAELEHRVDALAEALTDSESQFDDALRTAKLAALAEFAAGASHEINNPLAVISGTIQRVLSRETDPGHREALALALKQTKRIQELLQGTRQFARPPQPHREAVDVGLVVDDLVREMLAESSARRVELRVEAVGVTAYADPKHVRVSLGHLLRNAVEAAGESGWVRVGYTSDDKQVSVHVEDSGPGPAETAIPHLFDPFYSGREAGRGRGLGLSIAWRLATQNGGDVRFTPRPGLPTRFVLTLPTTGELRLFQSA